ncbi:MAG: hypothetical protein ACRD68_05595 [Pyrinomonadaceae bacterium]
MGTTAHGRVKIIKRAARNEPEAARRGEPMASARGDAEWAERVEKTELRDAAATVARWVGELRRRKGAEAARAFESLFREAA